MHLNHARTHPWNEFQLHRTSASLPGKTIPIIAQHGAVNTAGEMGPGEHTIAAQLPNNIQREFSFYFPQDWLRLMVARSKKREQI